MEPPEITAADPDPGRTPLQYSLRTIFILMTALAVVLSPVFARPEWLGVLTALVLHVMAPMLLTIGLMHGRGYLRTFCIGGLFPTGAVLMALGPTFLQLRSDRLAELWKTTGDATPFGLTVAVSLLVAYIVTIVFGLTAVGLRWMIEAG